jgi:hypothetical protein
MAENSVVESSRLSGAHRNKLELVQVSVVLGIVGHKGGAERTSAVAAIHASAKPI